VGVPRSNINLSGILRNNVKSFGWRTNQNGIEVAPVSQNFHIRWEIYTETGYGLSLWDTLWEGGKEFGLIPAGGAEFDSVRLEKGYRLWGSDIHTEYNPLEAGLGFALKLDKDDFLGKEALLKIKENGLKRKLSRMYFDEPGRIVMGKELILSNDKTVGYVTSSNYGYTIGKGIAYGYLPVELARVGTHVEILYFGRKHSTTVVG